MSSIRNLAQQTLHRLIATESEWNPKVMLARVAVSVLPERALHAVKKPYYAYLVGRANENYLVERDIHVVKHLVAEGDWVVDVGAAIGAFTKVLSHWVGPSGRVHSFEPIPLIFDFLSHNVRKLHLKNVELLNYAVSDAEGSATMVIPKYRWGSECWYDARIRKDPADSLLRQFTVPRTTLDSHFAGAGAQLSFIKCDANYHELECLRGALQTIRNSKPAMLIEIQPDPDDGSTHAFETFALLGHEGYKPYWFDGRAIRARRHGERSQNYFFLNQTHVEMLQKKNSVRLCLD
jgi:FkbM family methyltransferase